MYNTSQETEETSLLQILLHTYWILKNLLKRPELSNHDAVQDASVGE